MDRSWRQLREYDNQASQVLPWLNSAEDRLGRAMARPLKSDPAIIKQEINELKVRHVSSLIVVGPLRVVFIGLWVAMVLHSFSL